MPKLKTAILVMLVACLFLAGQAQAAEDKSMGLFLNLTTTQTGPAGHAVGFAGKMMKRGHPVTVFLNKHAVLFASKSAPQATYAMAGKTIRDMLVDLMKDGAKVIVCRVCAKMVGVQEADLVDGALLGNPDRVSEYLFDPKYQVISW
jgi:predicted peroxiredoxin